MRKMKNFVRFTEKFYIKDVEIETGKINISRNKENAEKSVKVCFEDNQSILLGRQENKIMSFVFTTKCNQKCIMCPQLLDNDCLENDMVLEIIANHFSYKGVDEVYITGGEPLIKSKYIDKIVEKSPQRVMFTILTNGVIIPSDFILKSQKVKFCIPLYSSYDELHNYMTGSNYFYRVIDNLIKLSTYFVPIELRFVITKLNYENMEEYVRFVYRNLPFVQNIAFMGMELAESAAENKDLLWVHPKEFLPVLEKAIDYLEDFQMPVSIYNLQPCLINEKYRKYIYNSISEWKRVFVSACDNCKMKGNCQGTFFSNYKEYEELLGEINEEKIL